MNLQSNEEKWQCSCGQENSGGFCVACGKPKPKENPSPQQNPPPQQNSSPRQNPPSQQNIEPTSATSKSSNKNVIIGAIVGMFLLAGGGFFAWQNLQDTDSANNEISLKNESAGMSENTTIIATYYIVNCDKSVTLRKNPSTTAVELAQVPLGQAVGFIEESGAEFCKVNHAGKVGYILSQYLSAEKPAPVTNAPAPVTNPPATNNQPANNNSTFTLGGIGLGDSIEKVRQVFGREDRITGEPTNSKHEYRDIVITYNGRRILGLVSYSPAVKTERNIHEGSGLNEVISAYGRRCAVQDLDGTTLYEYPYDTPQGFIVMRFAIKNGIVDYISLRLIMDNKEKSNILSLVKTI